jgi:hypothetical protein
MDSRAGNDLMASFFVGFCAVLLYIIYSPDPLKTAMTTNPTQWMALICGISVLTFAIISEFRKERGTPLHPHDAEVIHDEMLREEVRRGQWRRR